MSEVKKPASKPFEKWNTPDGHSPILAFVNSIHPISEAAIKFIDDSTFRYSISRGKHLVKSGEVCNYVYFIIKGVVRGYIKEGSKEITTWITAENEMVTSIRGFDLQIASPKNIQAIEDCEMIAIHYDDLQYLYNNFGDYIFIQPKQKILS